MPCNREADLVREGRSPQTKQVGGTLAIVRRQREPTRCFHGVGESAHCPRANSPTRLARARLLATKFLERTPRSLGSVDIGL